MLTYTETRKLLRASPEAEEITRAVWDLYDMGVLSRKKAKALGVVLIKDLLTELVKKDTKTG